MPRALITGITGQDGLYLSELLLDKGYEVFGLIRGQSNPQDATSSCHGARGHPAHRGSDRSLVLLRRYAASTPDEFYNLGAISFVAYSWENAMLTSDVTGKGVLNALEAVRLHSHDDRAGSASTRHPARRCSARSRMSLRRSRPSCGPARPTEWPRSSATT